MPRVPPFDRPATNEDVMKLPEIMVAEIVDGELHASPRPTPRHANAGALVGGRLVQPYHEGRGGPGGWWILDEPELHLSGNVLVPDLAGWWRTRMPRLPETAYVSLAPDGIYEILSPSTAMLDRAKKLALVGFEHDTAAVTEPAWPRPEVREPLVGARVHVVHQHAPPPPGWSLRFDSRDVAIIRRLGTFGTERTAACVHGRQSLRRLRVPRLPWVEDLRSGRPQSWLASVGVTEFLAPCCASRLTIEIVAGVPRQKSGEQ